jgi:hypothetical protein
MNNTLRLNFYYGRKDLNPSSRYYDWLVCWWTKSKFSHVELQFPDSISFSSSVRDHGCRFKYIDYVPSRWVSYEIPITVVTEYDIARIKTFCNQQVGKKYDWLGILFAQVLFLNIDNPNKWFCSEVLAKAFLLDRPNTYSPEKLLKFTENLLI